MKCKNYKITVAGSRYVDKERAVDFLPLTLICSNDEYGKTLSIDDGNTQFTFKVNCILNVFEGDYGDVKKA